jgi:putative Mg2+ transporter-C (MgtC) family protein
MTQLIHHLISCRKIPLVQANFGKPAKLLQDLEALMNIKLELILATKVLLALFVGGFMGWDRKHIRPAAGIRTYAAVCLGSCLFGCLSLSMPEPAERSRIAAQIVSGIGFLGAGVILRERGRIAGLTTAATIWAAAAVGLAIAFGMYLLAIITALLLYTLLEMHRLRGWEFSRSENPRQDEADEKSELAKPKE